MNIYLYCFLILLCMFPGLAHAQSIGLEIQPEMATVYAKPGSTITIPLVIKNTGNQGSFIVKGSTLIPQKTNGDLIPSEEITPGITINPPSIGPFFLPTGSKKHLEFSVAIDPQVRARDYYIGLNTISIGKKRSEGKSSMAIEMNTLSTVLLTVTQDGIMNISGYIDSFYAGTKADVRFFDSTQDIPLHLTMHNTGDNWMYTSGTISISNLFREKQLIHIPQQRVLANSKRMMRSSQIGIPFTTATLTGMHFGKYTATVRMTSEGKANMTTKSITFIALPFKLTGALSLIGIIAVFAGVYLNRPVRPRSTHPHKL